jgi:hypothetical protein
MTVQEILAQCAMLGVTLISSENGVLRVSPPGVLSCDLKNALKANRAAVRQLLTAPPADVMSDDPCLICGSRERWIWLDGRELCRVCVVLDQVPLTLMRQGWSETQEEATRG